MTMVGVERFDKSKLQTADQPKQSLAKSKDMTLRVMLLVSIAGVLFIESKCEAGKFIDHNKLLKNCV